MNLFEKISDWHCELCAFFARLVVSIPRPNLHEVEGDRSHTPDRCPPFGVVPRQTDLVDDRAKTDQLIRDLLEIRRVDYATSAEFRAAIQQKLDEMLEGNARADFGEVCHLSRLERRSIRNQTNRLARRLGEAGR